MNTLKNVAEVTAKASLAKQGVDVSKVELTEVDFPDMNGRARAGQSRRGIPDRAVREPRGEGGLRIIDRPYVGTKPGLQIGCYFASEQYLSENEDVVKRFREGVADTAAAIGRDPAAFRAFLPEAAEIPPPAAKKAVLPAWKAASDQASLELTAELMERYSVTDEKPETADAMWSDARVKLDTFCHVLPKRYFDRLQQISRRPGSKPAEANGPYPLALGR